MVLEKMSPDELQVQVTHDHFAAALPHIVPSVSASELAHYEKLRQQTHRFSDARIFCGFAYLAITLALSARFVVTLGEYTTNDFYWANFNTTGMQSFLADLCNAKLPLVYVPTLIDFNRSMAIPKDYSGANTRVVVSPARARSFLLQSIPHDQIIPALQATPFAINLLYPVPHCWVDFNRSFEMAHTAKRQRRCELNDRDNAAVYLESILRNAKFTDVVQSATFLDLNFTVFDALYKSDAGHTWMKYLTTHQVASVATEAATWTSAGLTRWVTQMSNAFQQGLVETITVVNALGIASTITIGNVPYRARGGAYWTTLKASFGIWNDLSICNMFIGCSLVRGASNHFEALGIDWDNDIVIGGMTSPVIELTRRYIGPYGSLDLRFVPVPTVLLDQVAEFQRAYYDRLQQNAVAMASYRSFSLAQVDPIPPLWHDMEFYGGNPMCTKVQPEPYVRETFGFYESCDSSATYSVVLGRDSAVFALQAMAFPSNAVRRICATCRTAQVGCGAALDGADTILSNLGGSIGNPDVPSAIDHLTKMNITMIQFASHNQSKVLLTQSMLDGAELWDFFGWVSMYDWVQGTREVYTFEGDEASVTLVSPYSASAEMTANSLEVPKSACKYMWYLAAYVTFVLTSVGALMVLFGTLIRFRTDPHQSFQFNRVVGSVWIGRPLLLLRGMTAATVLSTSTEQLITIQGFSQITYGQRSIWDVLVLANEALWINYVFVDICLPLTQGMPKSYPSLSSVLAWSVIVALECSSPYESRAVLQHNCVMQRAGREIQCQSGTLAIGSLNRVVLICVVSAIAVVQRCRDEVGNGAVFLETFLRNGDWRELSRCWGDALNVGVFDEVRTSTSGRDWISTALVDRRDGPVADEVKYWQSYGVSYFSTQWQNFKILGVVESYLVRNALGLTNMFTLKQLNATMQVDSETSNKMHWALAHTFNAICTNESSIGWRSLVRSSHNFAFQNQTPEVLLPEFQALYIPLGPALSAVRGMLGPFGSIDMIRVACPTSLRLLYRNLTEEVALFWRSNATALENATVLFKTQNFAPQMKAWSSRQLIGGNIMCEYDPRNLNTGSDVNEFFTILGRCNSNLLGTINPSGTNMVMSAIATGLNSTSNVKAICDCEKRFRDSCKLSLTVLSRFTPPIASIKSLVRAAIEDVRDTLGIALFQFARQMVNPMAVDVAPAMLFDPNEPEFEFFAWLYLFDWVEQVREVVTFVGEHGRLTTMSGMVLPIVETVNGMEIPTSVSFYVRCAIQYVTFVLLLVGCCLMCYFIAVRGYVEGWNMVKVNRVAGLVWVGRPLILLRGVVAVTLLSTPSLVLVQSPSGIVSYFVSPRRYWLTTFMTSGEACWLVYILNDLCSPLTLHYTAYASKSSNMVWFVTFVVSMLWPVQHEVSVERVCSVEAVDFQVVCKAGTVYFGSVSRCLQLVGISSVSCILCYYLERRCSVGRNDLQSPKCISPFLHAVATHSLHFANWQYNGVTYMDKATAAMMGILSIELHRTLYLFDIKSWRLYTIDPCGTRDSSMDPFLLQAVPLME
ncbi:hypothetical protein DYB32_007367 [Aphanomyces invadans]|uniref:Transmembrane protein n=1 Tax=Aphanomyces invadans TaxID=157072 RepID=A0A3R7CWU3_9STRA|nr:hypothetical protein DYB32_007367 [Aphanomyces invadans]